MIIFSGADVISAEMVFNPMQIYTEDNSGASDEIKFLYTIRSDFLLLIK